MPNLYDVLACTDISKLNLPSSIESKLRIQKVENLFTLHKMLSALKAFGKASDENFGEKEIDAIQRGYSQFLLSNRLINTSSPGNSEPRPINRPILTGVAQDPPPDKPKPIAQRIPSTTQATTTVTTNIGSQRSPAVTNTGAVRGQPNRTATEDPLAVWEKRFASAMKEVVLIGEIPVSKEELEEIGKAFFKIFTDNPSFTALIGVERKFPATLAVFLVGQGIYGYRGGDYWGGVCRAIGREAGPNFGRTFINILNRFRLPVIRELQATGPHFVSQILAHGGVPQYCLGDYFSNIVLPTVQREEFEGLDDSELIDEILSRSSSQCATDKPVIHFLEYGGRRAIDFFRRSRAMALEWMKASGSYSPEHSGLPKYVTDFFVEWAPQHIFEQSRKAGQRFRKPEVRMDPWGYGIYLYLPPQRLDPSEPADAWWKITNDQGEAEELPSTHHRKGYDLETEETILQIERIFQSCQVEFHSLDQVCSWTLSGVSEDQCVLCFEDRRGVLQKRIQARLLWLYYPKQAQLEIVGGVLLEKLPRLAGEWRPYLGEYWDLSQAEKITVIRPNQAAQEIPVSRSELANQPSLLGDPLPELQGQGDSQVFIGMPPKILIPFVQPLEAGPLQAGELAKWRVSIKPVGEADPSIRIEFSLADMCNAVSTHSPSEIEINLADPSLLGRRPTGTYQISVRGSLGCDASFTITLLPELGISGQQKALLPSATTGGTVGQLEIECGLLTRIENRNPDTALKVMSIRPGSYQVEVPGDIENAQLDVIFEKSASEQVRVPIDLRVKRVRWRLIIDRLFTGEWQDRPISQSITTFLQYEAPFLLIQLPDYSQKNMSACIWLVDMTGHQIQKIEPTSPKSRYSQDNVRFDLAGIMDSLRNSGAGNVHLELLLDNPQDPSGPTRLPVVSLARALEINNLHAYLQDEGDSWQIQFSWHEERPLQLRVLNFWSNWQPWQPSYRQAVPDEMRGWYSCTVPKGALIAGEYTVGMSVAEPWGSDPPSPHPPQGLKPIAVLSLVSPQRRLEGLQATPATSRGMDNHLEAAVLSAKLGNLVSLRNELEWIVTNFVRANARQVVLIDNLINQVSDPRLTRTYQQKLIDPARLKRFHQEILFSSISVKEFDDLIANNSSRDEWSSATCVSLTAIRESRHFFPALEILIEKDLQNAIELILALYEGHKLTRDDAVDLLYEKKSLVIEALLKSPKIKGQAAEIMELLRLYSPYSGLPTVKVGSWIECNAGKGRILRIEDPTSHQSMEEFMEGKGSYNLLVALHIEFDPLSENPGDKAILDVTNRRITFQRATAVYVCGYCEEFATSRRTFYTRHLICCHGGHDPQPATSGNNLPLTRLNYLYASHSTNR